MNFLQMKNKVTDYLNRTNLTSIVPDFINMSIHRMEKKNSFKYMLKTLSTYSFEDGTYYYSVPSDYKKAKWFKWLDGSELEDIVQVSEEEAILIYPDYTNDTGDPLLFAHIPSTSKFLIRPTPDASITAYLRYWGYSTDLSSDSDTHWLLTNAWEAVLYGALVEAQPYIQDDARMALWLDMYKDAIRDLRNSEFDSDDSLTDKFSTPSYRA